MGKFDKDVDVKRVEILPGERLLVTVLVDPASFDETLVCVGLSNTLQTEVIIDPDRVMVFDKKTKVWDEG